LAAKRLELLHELVPAATRVAVLVNPDNARNTEITLKDAETAARAKGLQIQVFNASTNREIEGVFATLARERPDAARSNRARLLVQLSGRTAAFPGSQSQKYRPKLSL
jgi:ABC-type uncharacterized transport system substrate-binding protein